MQTHFKTFSQIVFMSFIGSGLFIGNSFAQIDDITALEETPSLELPEDSAIQPLLPEVEAPEMIPPQTPADITEVESAPAAPQTADLKAPVAEDAAMPDLPESAVADEFDENIFFDAEALVPSSELSQKGAPSKVNPTLSPGSRLVVAKRNYNSGSKEARLVAAERAMKLGRHESALEIYQGLYAANKRDPNILVGRAVALQRIGRDEEAIQAYEELLSVKPKNLDGRVNMQGLLGKRYPAVALRNLMEIHEGNPGNTSVIAQLAVAEAQMGRYPEAIRYLGMAASMEPENPGHIFNMAVIADRAGDKKKAIQYYEEALDIDTLYGSGRGVPRDSIFERLAQLR